MLSWAVSEAARIFNLPYTTLTEWLNRFDFVPPIQRSDGRGEPAKLSIHTLYCLAFFYALLQCGVTREEAFTCARAINFDSVGEGKNETKYAVRVGMHAERVDAGRWVFYSEVPDVAAHLVSMSLINLKVLKEKVNKLVEE